MRIFWVYEVFNWFGISEGLFASYASGADEAKDRIFDMFEYPVSHVRFIEGVLSFRELDFEVELI